MTTLQTGFELAPAGTAIPTTGVAGDGDAFSGGTNGTGNTFTSDNSIPAAIASGGSYCAKLTTPATATTAHRFWSITTSTPSFRVYLYLPAAPNAAWDLLGPIASGALVCRLRINANLTVSHTLGSSVTDTTTGTLPTGTLIRIEGTWGMSTTAGTFTVDCYTGDSTTPIAGLSLSVSGLAMSAATTASFRIGTLSGASGPTSLTAYTDAWAVSDSGRVGPVVTTVTGSGALAASPATLSGSGTVTSGTTGSGALAAQPATLTGSGTLTVTGTGALAATPATLSGSGAPVITGTGATVAAPATLSGAGALDYPWDDAAAWNDADPWPGPDSNGVTGSGTLTAAPAALTGAGTLTTGGTGSLTPAPAALAGVATLTVAGAGNLAAQAATLAAAGLLAATGTGALTAAPAELSGRDGGIPPTIGPFHAVFADNSTAAAAFSSDGIAHAAFDAAPFYAATFHDVTTAAASFTADGTRAATFTDDGAAAAIFTSDGAAAASFH